MFVPDMELADDFYGGVLGLDRIDGGEDFRIFRGPDFEMLLFKCEEASSPEGYSQRAGSALCFAVPDILESMEYLRQKDVQLLHTEPQAGPNLQYVAFADPFGTVHEIVEYSS